MYANLVIYETVYEMIQTTIIDIQKAEIIKDSKLSVMECFIIQ